jgi:hypothetical protein
MIRTEKVIDVADWDALVQKTYGRYYEFQQQDGCKERQRVRITVPDEEAEGFDFQNDTVPEKVNHKEQGVSFKAWLARDPKQLLTGEGDGDIPSLRLWWSRNFYPCVEMVANDLHAKGLLEAGEYSIDIDW